MSPARSTFVWGLKRSGIHLVVGWLYANHGAIHRHELPAADLHPQLGDGFADESAGVAFFNNCGRLHSRDFALGSLDAADFSRAADGRRAAIFGIEDCRFTEAERMADVADAVHVLVARDPLNHLASRLEAARTRPEVFPVGLPFVDLLDSYCAELLGRTRHLDPKVVVTFNDFVAHREARDAVAAQLGLENLDAVSEVSDYGGGSSFSGSGPASSAAALLRRFEEHPLPAPLLDLLLDRPAIGEASATIFGLDLATAAGRG